jgi:hypothetical protein
MSGRAARSEDLPHRSEDSSPAVGALPKFDPSIREMM